VTRKMPLLLQWLCLFAISALTLELTACDGSDGNDGAPGAPAPPPGVDIGNATEINAAITGVTIASPPVVDFTLTDGNGNAVKNLPASSISFTIAKLIPGTDGNASAWQSYINTTEQPGVGPGTEAKVQATSESGSAGTFVDNNDGSYRYTFSFDINNVTDPIPVGYQPTLTHRVSFQIRGFVPVDNPAFDFRPSDNAQGGIFSREIVSTVNCNVCHENLAYHGGNRFELRFCMTCHNSGTSDANSGHTVDATVMFHKIHRGASLPSVIGGTDYCLYGFSDNMICYGDLVYPQDIRNCSNCHDENDPDTPDAANWYRVPTAEACGACHDNVDFQTGANHGSGIVADNSQCSTCHASNPNSSIEVRQAHRIPGQELAAQYQLNIVNITSAIPTTSPIVDFSVTDPSNGNAPYDLSDSAIAAIADGLRFSMGWNTTDYTNEGFRATSPPRTSLYVGGVLQATLVGPGVYQIPLDPASPVPAGTQGSGAVAFEGRVESAGVQGPVTSAVDFFAITDTDAVPRRQKADIARCNDCHQLLTRHGSANNDNIDDCVICHNPSSYSTRNARSVDFKVMVHRIHSEVRYPQRLSNCKACHTDTGFYPVAFDSGVLASTIDPGTDNTTRIDSIIVSPNSAACSVCHTDATAKLHMEQNGGTFKGCQDASGTITQWIDICGPGGTLGPVTVESCTVCHAAGRIADVAVTHSID